jgi:hypothetical protein
MSQELAQTLTRERIVTGAQLDEALERQVVFGGSLDTNLLEAGTVSEPDLLRALSLTFKSPPTSKANIDQIGGHIPRLFPLVFAETYHLVPYRLIEEDFWVLVNGAPDEQLLLRIHDRLRLRVVTAVTTEARLHYAMHRLYGTTLLPRFQNLIQKLDGELPKAPESAAGGREHVLSWGMSSAPIAAARSRNDNKRPTLDVRALLARLDAATDRDNIVEILLGATIGIFDFAGLFLVQGDTVNGWRGTTPESTQKIVRVNLKVELPSVFQTIYATQGHYLGPLPQNSINAKLLADMGRSPPRAALVAPITVGGKLAAMLYADNGDRGVPPKRGAAVLMLAQRAGMCLEQLLRRRKAQLGQPKAAATTASSQPNDAWMVPAPAPVPTKAELVPQEPAAAARALPNEAQALADAGQAAADAEIELEAIEVPEILEAPEGSVEDVIETGDGYEAVEVGDNYEAFSDVKDEGALDDWQDVLLEASGSAAKESQPESKRRSAPPSVSWDDVIAEAERAATFLSGPQNIEVAGQVVDQRDILFDGLEALDGEVRRGAVEKLAAQGSAIDSELRQRFPGPVSFNPLAPDTQLPPFRRVNGFCDLLATRGPTAAQIVLAHIESEDPTKRFFATYFLHAVPYPPALGALARRLYDTEPRIRYLAADALRTYSKESGYNHIVQGLRDQLKVPILETQVTTIEVLGQLREPSAVPSLIPMVIAPRAEVQNAASSALAVICAQAFGPDVTRWAQWWQSRYNRPRGAWLIEGLHHPHPTIVRIAHGELMLLSGRSIPFDPEGPAEQRDQVVRAWEDWWAQASKPPPAATSGARSSA